MQLNDAELKLGRLIWPFVLATGEINVGPGGEWNHLTFDELMSIPEEQAPADETAVAANNSIEKQKKKSDPPSGGVDAARPKNRLPKLRPCLHVGEDIVWKTLTGHGVDFKRVPLLEWKLLIVIGSTREDGILQGDLVRATGQDKRSVPRRTDFLSAKGYIAKRTHMVRGSKTSKLWLARFAPELPAPSNPLHGLDMSPEALTKDMDPVPWVHQWVGNKNKQGQEEIGYMSLGSTMMAIIKAWGTLRVADLKKKLGILGLRWQMKVMSRMLRRFDVQGNINYVAATFVGDSFVFKDCVKFMRDPTDEDWRMLLATKKKSAYSDDGRGRRLLLLNKRKKKKAKGNKGRKPGKVVKPKLRVLKKRTRNPPKPIMSLWCPEKPLANTIAEFVLTGGAEGYTSPELSKAITGHDFCRYFLRHLQNSCAPGVQPATLSEYQMSSELIRTGKIKAYTFTCAGARKSAPAAAPQEESVIDPALASSSRHAAQLGLDADIDAFGFAPVNAAAFQEGISDLDGLVRIIPDRPGRQKRPYNRRQQGAVATAQEGEIIEPTVNDPYADLSAEASPPPGPRPRGRPRKRKEQPENNGKADVPSAADASGPRPPKRRKAAERVSYSELAGEDEEAEGSGPTVAATGGRGHKRRAIEATQTTKDAGVAEAEHLLSEESDQEQDRTRPGVYFGKPGSLNPDPHKKGRPRRSIVLIFRSEKFRDPNFLPATAGTSAANSPFADKSKAGAKRGKKSKKVKLDKYVCEKCGGEWANDNGLQYHLEKGRNLCNPYYAEHPEEMERPKPNRAGQALLAGPERDLDTESSSQSSSRGSLNKRVGGLGVVPRGVQASEAVAKETAAAKPAHLVQDVSIAEKGSDPAASHQNGATLTPEEEEDEDLPYLRQIQTRTPKPSRTLKPEVFKKQDIFKERDGQAGHVEVVPETMDIGSPQHEPSLLPSGTPNALDLYPADVLGPAVQTDHVYDIIDGTAPVNGGPSVSPAMTGPAIATARHSLPASRKKPLVESQNTPAAQILRQVEVDADGQPLVRMPVEDYTAEGYTDSIDKALPQRSTRIQEIIKYLLDINGVFPTERPLFWAVLKVYIATFECPPYPSLSGCTRAVTTLAGMGVIKQATVAIRPRGQWKSLNFIMQPEIDVTHALCVDLKERTKNADPEMYIPPPFDPTEEEKVHFQDLERPPKHRNKGVGRRDHKLAEGIEQLTAPFYAEKGMAGVRPGLRGRGRIESDDEDDERSNKRRKTRSVQDNAIIHRRKRKHTGTDEGMDSSPAKKGRRGRKPRGDLEDDFIVEPHKLSINDRQEENPGLSSLPASFFSGTSLPSTSGYIAPTEIQFLEPNTQLEDDHIPEPETEANAPSPSNESTLEEEPAPEPVVEPGTYSRALELKAHSKGVWPYIPLGWFEKNEGSFAMKGWLPGQIDMLMENLPKTMEQMAFKITSHSKTENWADPQYGVFCTSVDGCRAWELSEQGTRQMSGSIAPNYLFMNFCSTEDVSSMAPIDPQWLDENEWTLETIPYEMLEDDDEEPSLRFGIIPVEPVEKRKRGRPRTKPRPQPPVAPPPARDSTLREVKMQRELTPYPQTAGDYFRVKGQDCLGVDWKAEDTRIAAYVAVSTLTGGINKAMDWGLMMRIFPESKLSNLRRFWSMIKKEREGFILTLTARFQEEFLEAYENGDLPPFDFDNPLDYEWPRLVKWTLALVVREGIDLPAAREQFDEELDLIFVDKADFDWRETYHNWQRSVFNKFQDSTSEPASARFEPNRHRMEDNDAIIARSWVRALCCTDADQYTPYQIRDKFLALSRNGHRSEQEVSNLLETTIFDLEHRRIAIKQKSSALATGRPYKLNEHFCRTLDRYSNEDKFTVAAEFKLKLDRAFRKGEPVEIPWRTEDGMIVAALNMQAHGRVRIEPVRKLDIPFGFRPGFYESRKFPKSYYRFDLQIVPTPNYLYNEDIGILPRATRPDNIPLGTEDGKLPMWCDFFGRPDRNRWFKMLGSVLFVLATRGAMTDEFAASALKPCLEEFEVETVRKWGLKEGLLTEMTVPGGAVTVTEWWWLVLGVPMLEMSTTAVPEASGDGGRRTKDQYAEWASGRSRRRGKYRVIH
ncbi:hypothetical protein M406DRAFT_269034 [Cryphonectria parasitica EP155]|uniref:Uncharacterized protein n=1 Tax=Cryphonectria parasitica (strain ATCC 38755 / EP155) TaxID=660469 RepID=A0A9P5CK13_CRYP1|nr:uncharacterized protein M406DRAFT_269034 [Cryphonectria parasitica EP155]KAF3760280.1 hypothetical protein M406DRAFT_269034 [Cryphonectria parasitica EP155]